MTGASGGGGTAPGTTGRIDFLISALNAGGAERQLIGLASGLVGLGWDVRVVTFIDGGAMLDDLLGRGIAVESLHRRGIRDLPAFAWRLVRTVRRRRPDVIHSYLLGPNLTSALLKPVARGARIVWGVRASDMNLDQYGRRAAWLFALSGRLARFADAIICNSVAGLEHHAQRGYPRRRMVVVSNGIDAAGFAPNPAARAAIRGELGVADTDRLIGIVGRLDPMKDHATFLRAAALAAAERSDARFVIVGDGPGTTRDVLQGLAAELGIGERVKWAGRRSDLASVHNALDLLVSSSAWGEGFSNVVAEAMATGVPCVVTDVGDSAAVVGDTGWVCPPGEPGELAGAILAALADPAELTRRGAAARERVVREFSEQRRDETTAAILGAVIRGDGLPRA